MKKKSFLLGLLGLLTLIPLGAHAEDVLMPQFGKQVITVEKDKPITFYDYKGTESMNPGSSNNSYATTIFKSAEKGYAVSINFEEFEVKRYGDYYDAKLYLYDGVFDTTKVTYPTSGYGIPTYPNFPETNNLLATLTGTYTNLTYISTGETGALSCCFYFKDPYQSTGWKATVSLVELKPMEVTSATADYSGVEAGIYAGDQAKVLGAVKIVTEGQSPYDTLQTLTFTLDQSGIYDATKLMLFYQGTQIKVKSSQEGNTYTLTVNQALATGDNEFVIKANVLDDAAWGATSTLTFTGLTTKNGYNTLTAGTPVEQTIMPRVLMQKGNNTYTVDREIPFYDDGGKSGKMSMGFQGTATFVPATAGKIVKMDVSNIDLFFTDMEASEGGMSDTLKFYSGKTADEANLLCYIAKNSGIKNISLQSMAEDGAITVYLHANDKGSNSSWSSQRKNGFEAVVSEMTPADMVLASATVTKQSGKVAGCATDAEMMEIYFKTENTLNALQPTAFVFNTGDTYTRIANATLYYAGSTASMDKAQKVGSVAVEGNEFTVNASGITLPMGDNYFYLTYDVSCNVKTGDKVAANITSVKFGNNTEYKDFTNGTDVLTVENTVYSNIGTKVITVYHDWTFTHTPGSGYYSNVYQGVKGNQITTFIPATQGNVIQMDFADFAIAYSAAYGVSTFKIYSGSEVNETKLLWASDATKPEAVPGKVRGNVEDGGSLTVLFDANISNDNYVSAGGGKGWHAAVTEYTPKDMTITNTELAALSTDAPLLRGQKHAEIMSMKITTEGNLNPVAIGDIAIGMNPADGGWNALDSILLMQGDKVICQAEVTEESIYLFPTATLAEGENEFTIAVNVKSDAAYGTKVMFELIMGDNIGYPDVPENGRTIRNIYNLEKGYHRVEVGESALMFYDDGGKDNPYSESFTGEVTFVPTVANSAIQITFKQWTITGQDDFYVYFADTVQGSADKTFSYYTTSVVGTEVLSRSQSGAMTIKFVSGTYPKDGWEIEVSCHELQPLALDSVKVEAVAPAEIMRGSANVAVLRAAVYVSGDQGKMPVENFNVETLNTATVKAYKGTEKNFSVTDIVTTDTILYSGTYYYYLTLDIPADTEEGTAVTATLKSVDVNKTTVQPKNEVTATCTVSGGMHGSYIIGASDAANYKTFADAITAMKTKGIESAVTFLVETGTYTGQITMPEIKGASAENRITFTAQSGNREDVVIEYNINYGNGVFIIDGADYVTLSNLTIKGSSNSPANVVYISNMAQYVTIDNCYITAPTATSTNSLIKVQGTGKEGLQNDYLTVSSSLLEGSCFGVNLTGASNVDVTKETGVKIINNSFKDQGSFAVYIQMGQNTLIDGNTINSTKITTSRKGMMRIFRCKAVQISNNYLYMNITVNSEGIYIQQCDGTEDAPIRIFNNVLDIHTTGTLHGIYMYGSAPYTTIANNTIRTYGSKTYPFYVGAAQTSMQVINNIFYAEDNAAYAVGSSKQNFVTSSKFEHNLLYSAGSKLAYIGGGDDTDITDIATWKETSGSATDINEAVTFESEDVLRPVNKGNLVSGQVLDFITTDITGRERAAVPTIGAYEWENKIGTDCPSSEATAVRVFPTITRDMLNISGAEGATVRVLNMQGQELMRIALTAEAETLNVTALPQGAYLMDVNGTVFRFIKQ